MDRVGTFNLWIALDEVTADMGAMRFLTGSHREGPLGEHPKPPYDLFDRYPKLLELYEFSPPFHYRPGDATAHHAYMIYGSPPNHSDRPRWSYIPTFVPDDCVIDEGTWLGMPEPHERFSLIRTA